MDNIDIGKAGSNSHWLKLLAPAKPVRRVEVSHRLTGNVKAGR